MYIRETCFSKLISYKDNGLIKVITGARRCGKSTVLLQYSDYLRSNGVLNDHIYYLNLESFENLFIRDVSSLHQSIVSYFGDLLSSENHIYVMLDEIQLVSGWEQLVNGLNTIPNVDIVVTGSNSFILSSDLATHISGRYVEISLFPLSFSEFVQFNDISPKNVDDSHLNEYLEYGGFPTVVLSDERRLKSDFLMALWDSVVIKDVAKRIKVGDIGTLERIVTYICDTTANPISVLNIVNYIKSSGGAISHETVSRYIKALEDAYIVYHLVRYDIKGKSILKTGGKYFVVDTGIRNIRLGKKSDNLGSLLEGVVYFELKRRGYQLFLGKQGKYEIDFVAHKDNKRIYIQVCLSMMNENTREREFRALKNINDDYPKVVISMDKTDFSSDGIMHLNLLEFLLSRGSKNII